ncbi:Transcriptional regulator, TetR family [Myxococcus hansupus]|uniref:Transcriptional regulator, TetR family n=1 Tax=Pseudomyxococcus hansupus TaxID=1297742 RepID=A0A0H4WK53_9BACT|nr:TetR/AcrR family transcriptional regulator [Myxococcus hansupus]AKQ63741.1 Transcriptional regulator, TetR family [Myxococcus hansupus]
MSTKRRRDAPETRRQLVEAAVRLMMRQGYSATTVDQVCAEASLTKGSFFHHFESKEAMGLAAMGAFAEMGMALYAEAWGGQGGDPLVKLHRLLDVMTDLARQHGEMLTCMVGMLSQELALSNATVREAGDGHMRAWVDVAAGLLADAKRVHSPRASFDPEAVAWMLYSTWQGSMLVGKTRQRPEMVIENLRQMRLFIDGLFAPRALKVKSTKSARA